MTQATQLLFGFHAVTVRLKVAPRSVVEVHVDPRRNDQRMRQLLERAREAGATLACASSLSVPKPLASK